MTMGDVLAVVAGIAGICLAWPALMVWIGLIFPARVEAAARRVEESPWRSLATGVLLLATVGVTALALLGASSGALKLAGWLLALPLAAIGTMGAGGMALLLGTRMRAQGEPLAPVSAVARGAFVYVLAALFPIIGWFIFVPLVGATVVGGGALALISRRPRAATELPTPLEVAG